MIDDQDDDQPRPPVRASWIYLVLALNAAAWAAIATACMQVPR